MEKEFVPYEFSFKLKALGFDEPCFGYYDVDEGYSIGYAFCYSDRESQPEIGCSAPLYQQAFRWFRERYEKYSTIEGSKMFGFQYFIYEYNYEIKSEETFKTYEEAEIACLDKLIEIVESE